MIIDSACSAYEDNFKVLEEKFRLWDTYSKNTGDLLSDKKAVLMLRDPSIFIYAFFRDSKGDKFRVTNYQDLILNCKHDYNPFNNNRFIVFKAANQIGKTETLCFLAIHAVFMEDNQTIIIVSQSLPQAQNVLNKIRLLLNRSVFANTWKEDIGEQANTTILSFVREKGKVVNRIICAPCGEGLLGYPVTKLFLDEADFYEDAKNFFYKIALPRTNQTKGQIIVFSNPNPDISRSESLLWDLWTGDLFTKKFSFNFMDAPWNTLTEYEALRKQIPSYIFSSTFDGEFGIEGGGFFTQSEIENVFNHDWNNTLPLVNSPVFISVDFGKVRDNTVLSLGVVKEECGVCLLEVRYLQRFDLKTPYPVILDRLKEIVNYYDEHFFGVGGIGFDKTGVGGSLSDFASVEKNLGITDIVWSAERKTRLYADFKLMVETNRLRIVFDDECKRQMSGLVFKKTPRGYLTVENRKDAIHDDYPDCIAMLINISIRRGIVLPGFNFIGFENKKSYEDTFNGWESNEITDDDIKMIDEVNRLRGGHFGC